MRNFQCLAGLIIANLALQIENCPAAVGPGPGGVFIPGGGGGIALSFATNIAFLNGTNVFTGTNRFVDSLQLGTNVTLQTTTSGGSRYYLTRMTNSVISQYLNNNGGTWKWYDASVNPMLELDTNTLSSSLPQFILGNAKVTFDGSALAVDGSASLTGVLTGNGSGLTNLNASQLASGTVPVGRLTNTAASGLTLYGVTTNENTAPNMTGGRWHTNFSTGNWIRETNGVITMGGTNSAEAKFYAGSTGAAFLAGNLTVSNNGVSTVISSNLLSTATITNQSSATSAVTINAGGTITLVVTNGQVGIGTSTPAYKLHVAGDGFISSTLTVSGNIVNVGGALSTFSGSTVQGFVAGTTLTAGGVITATNGFVSYSSNLLASTSITVTASPFLWTNTLTKNVYVFVDGSAVTGTIGINGTSIFSSMGNSTVPLQPREYVTVTYTVGTPTARFKPF